MAVRFVLTDYLNQAMAQAVYDKLEDGSFSGRIPACTDVVAFRDSLKTVRMNFFRRWKTGS
jgi:hypothetical protein